MSATGPPSARRSSVLERIFDWAHGSDRNSRILAVAIEIALGAAFPRLRRRLRWRIRLGLWGVPIAAVQGMAATWFFKEWLMPRWQAKSAEVESFKSELQAEIGRELPFEESFRAWMERDTDA